MKQKPTFVYRDGMQPSAQYVEWLSDVKTGFSDLQEVVDRTVAELELKEYKKSMIYEYVTGKKEV